MPEPRLVRAWLDSPTSGIVEFDRDWEEGIPPLTLEPPEAPVAGVAPAKPLSVAREYGYYASAPGEITFILTQVYGGSVDTAHDRVFVAGDFNGWNTSDAAEAWLLKPAELDGEHVLTWSGPAAGVGLPAASKFKFVTGEGIWLEPPPGAPNAFKDEHGNTNRLLDPARMGRQLWQMDFATAPDLGSRWAVSLAGPAPASVQMMPGPFFFGLGTRLPLGARVKGDETEFRIFAPRAKSVTLHVCEALEHREAPFAYPLSRRSDAPGVWEGTLEQNLHLWYYWYTIDGLREGPGHFDASVKVLDPYALASVGRQGPGIILDRGWVGKGDRGLKTPFWHELVIAEAHVRDLAANAPIPATPEERRGFTGLRKWVESPEFYLHHLGVNCVELQPVQQFDAKTQEEYHWGYMPTNYFAPASGYSLDPERASGVREFQELVAAFHRRGMAVILDVVYNHVGDPAHLLFVDSLYYFDQDSQGVLSNWSGCGNDLRSRAAMVRRLIIDSCRHLIEAYGVDGFRFDLADLIGVDALVEIEAGLKKAKPDVILIAEPWSFRGHIAGALRDTGWASWNDGYRNFVRDYVLGHGSSERLEYFLRGSPWYFAKWPAQTVNYTESHDDRTWIDAITVHAGGDGSAPSSKDRRRTHLMAAILFMSVGIPMLAAGQDFLRSKHGVNNTYQRGDLNALDYRRLYRYLSTHTYFAEWIALRRGARGRLLRHFSRPSEGFFRFFPVPNSPALAMLVNADFSLGPERLLFAVNPGEGDCAIPIGTEVAGSGRWRQLADQERFYSSPNHGAHAPVEAELYLPTLGCSLWTGE